MTLPILNRPNYRVPRTPDNAPPFSPQDANPRSVSVGGTAETNRLTVTVEADYEYMDDDEQDAAFRALSLARLQGDLHDDPDYDPEV